LTAGVAVVAAALLAIVVWAILRSKRDAPDLVEEAKK
jgi:hypothetical protein